MYLIVVVGFILFIILLSGNTSVIRKIIYLLAIPLLIWIALRIAMLVGIAFRSGLVGGIILAVIAFYLFKTHYKKS